MSSDPKVDLLRHTLATIAYRGRKAVQGAPDDFGGLRIGPTTRTPVEILAHIGDLLEWAGSLLRGERGWKGSGPLPWAREVERFFRVAEALDREVLATKPSEWSLEQIFQGPLADALTHIGQLTMMRRLSGHPVRGENYAMAKIEAGRLGEDQADPHFEFD